MTLCKLGFMAENSNMLMTLVGVFHIKFQQNILSNFGISFIV
jgi:hypothetical protein